MNSFFQSMVSPFPRHTEILIECQTVAGTAGWPGISIGFETGGFMVFLLRRK
jgi:type II secretory pathway component PulF